MAETGTTGPSGRRRGRGREEVGVVVSDRMDKTVVVAVERSMIHPLYEKVIRSRRTFLAHDADNSCRVGDRVRIVECRPLSRRKRWRVAQVVERGPEGRQVASEAGDEP